MTDDRPVWVLVHSPLVGPITWATVGIALGRRDIDALIPSLMDDGDPATPYWQRHAASAARVLAFGQSARSVILAGHSGAGPLLPLIGRALGRPVSAYLFVDAGIPHDGASRLNLLAEESPEFARQFRRHLEAGGRFPEWTDEQLRELIPDARLRAGLLADLRPRDLRFWSEPIPVPAGWPDAPCAYLQFSAPYDVPAARARALGWRIRRLDAGHFHMLVDPDAVAEAMLALSVP